MCVFLLLLLPYSSCGTALVALLLLMPWYAGVFGIRAVPAVGIGPALLLLLLVSHGNTGVHVILQHAADMSCCFAAVFSQKTNSASPFGTRTCTQSHTYHAQ